MKIVLLLLSLVVVSGLRVKLLKNKFTNTQLIDILTSNKDKSHFESTDTVHVMEVPAIGENVAPIIYTVPLQLLAYHVAVLKGTDVDQPRNLAKSVTVE